MFGSKMQKLTKAICLTVAVLMVLSVVVSGILSFF